VVTPAAVTALLSTTLRSEAIVVSGGRVKGNNGLGNGEDPPPPGIAMQGKPQNDNPAVPGQPQYKGVGSGG